MVYSRNRRVAIQRRDRPLCGGENRVTQESRKPTRRDIFNRYIDQNDHQSNRVEARINALLTGQSFLVAGAAFASAERGSQNVLLYLIASLGIVMSGFAFVAIRAGCRTIRDWFDYRNSLIKEDEAAGDDAKELEGLYLPKRTLPDIRHTLSVDVFGYSLPVMFALFWLFVLIWTLLRQG